MSVMEEKMERICLNCNSFFPDTFEEATEYGICLADEAFEPYIDELLDTGNQNICHELIQEKRFLSERVCCSQYEEIEIMDLPEKNLDDFLERMVVKSVEQPSTPLHSFKDHSFSELMKISEPLRKLREDYASHSAEERRMAADYEYHAASANQLFYDSIGQPLEKNPIPGEVVALAIDPDYAPAILTVGSMEYIQGRVDDAIALLLSLTKVPKGTEDLFVIIDKAGDFLIDRSDFDNALALYMAGIREFREEPRFYSGASYCLGKLGKVDDSVVMARKAVELVPDNHEYLNDLGFSLVLAGQFNEAETVLQNAISLSPPDYKMARNNLEFLKERKNGIN